MNTCIMYTVGNGSDYSSLDVSGSSSPHNMRLSSTGNG